jgi:mannose-6-phosphate isomerase
MREDLSIQVHQMMNWQKKHNSFGKTEMWYIMQAMIMPRMCRFKENSNAMRI